MSHPLVVKRNLIIKYLVVFAHCCSDVFSDRHLSQESWKVAQRAAAEGSPGKAYFARKVTKADSPPLHYSSQGNIVYRNLESIYSPGISRFLTANAFPAAALQRRLTYLYTAGIFFPGSWSVIDRLQAAVPLGKRALGLRSIRVFYTSKGEQKTCSYGRGVAIMGLIRH